MSEKVIPEALRDITLDGQPFTFLVRPYEVLSDKTWSETHVTSSGGGGYIQDGSGIIRAPQIHSHTIQRTKVWVRDLVGGTEITLDLSGCDLECRPGHTLQVVYIVRRGEKAGWNVGALNENTGAYANFFSEYRWFLKWAGIGPSGVIPFIPMIVLTLGALLYGIHLPFTVPFFVPAALFVGLMLSLPFRAVWALIVFNPIHEKLVHQLRQVGESLR